MTIAVIRTALLSPDVDQWVNEFSRTQRNLLRKSSSGATMHDYARRCGPLLQITEMTGQRFNVVTSIVGLVAAVVGTVFLLLAVVPQGDPWKDMSLGIYGVSLVLLYLFTTLYHALRGKSQVVLQKLDHYAIYLLIAGTYTPFCLVTLRGNLGWTLFALEWGLAVVGIVIEMLPGDKHRILPVVIYVTMGWLIVFVLGTLRQVFPEPGLTLMAVGGLFYTGGIVFYALDKRFTWAHGVWHLFVLAGSFSHYVAVYRYIA